MEKWTLLRSGQFPNHTRTGEAFTVRGKDGKEIVGDLDILYGEPGLYHLVANGPRTLRVVCAWRILRGDTDDLLKEVDQFSTERIDGIADQPCGFGFPDPAHFILPATLGHQIPASGLTLIRTRFV
jgi:hypothetical protein